MLAIQLKNWLQSIPDYSNILIYTSVEKGTRQLLMSDLDINQDKNVVIDAEYEPPVKTTIIKRKK